MSHDRFAARANVCSQPQDSGCRRLVVSSPANLRYLTGFTGEDSAFVLGRKLAVLVSDSRFQTQISDECPQLEAFIRSGGPIAHGRRREESP